MTEPKNTPDEIDEKREQRLARMRKNFQNWYNRNKSKKLASNEVWRKQNWEKVKQQTYDRRDPLKHKARQAINNAVKAGKFEKKSCLRCGALNTDFHHTNGYDEENWFDGIWLCRVHHAQLHRKARENG